MRTKLAGMALAGLLVVGGATAVLAQSESTDPETGPAPALDHRPSRPTILADVLADLVEDGVITQAQADAITEAVDERKAELRERAEELRERVRALREQVRRFLEDGVISADELRQLPEEHPLRNLDEYLDDGQLTRDELRQLRPLGRGWFGFGHRHGPGPWAPPADGAAATGSSFSID